MQLEGVVTNVAAFGAFVDIGVHQDGLVHISAMSTKRIAAPSEVVKAGDVVRVLVLSIDVPRRRIGLSMRLDDPIDRAAPKAGSSRPDPRHMESKPTGKAEQGGALADALRRAASQQGRRG